MILQLRLISEIMYVLCFCILKCNVHCIITINYTELYGTNGKNRISEHIRTCRRFLRWQFSFSMSTVLIVDFYWFAIVFFLFRFTVDTEIPIIKHSTSPPPATQNRHPQVQQQSTHQQQQAQHQQQQQQHHQQHQQRVLLQIKTEQTSNTNQAQISHRPLLHNLLSGTAIHSTPYHRNYCTSSTGQYTCTIYLLITFQDCEGKKTSALITVDR